MDSQHDPAQPHEREGQADREQPQGAPNPANAASLLLDDLLRWRRQDASSSSGMWGPLPGSAGRSAGHPLPLPGGDFFDPSHDSMSPAVGLPNVGDALFGFQLRQELGQGSFGRVFLAEQPDLASRLVVVKVSPPEGGEHQTLAQLQHTHIVPIHSVHEDARLGVRAVCMPYFGGTSLNRVLGKLWEGGKAPQEGSQLVEALRAVQGPPATRDTGATPDDQVPLATLARLSYVQASCWVVARLAEGLQHAHQRGVLHRDIKPSNILCGSDGTPYLLDFNLAQDQAVDLGTVNLGGTVAYMAPEHLRALGGRTPALARLVSRPADIYSLGLVLYEMLTGHRPFEQDGSYAPLPVLVEAMAVERGKAAPSLRRARPDCPWSLESIVRKCLDPDPTRRYQRAEELAEDLRRFLTDQPLRYAPELSFRETVGKWARRHPRLVTATWVTGAAGVLLTVALLLAGNLHDRLTDARERLAEAASRDQRQAFETGATRALCLINTNLELQDHLSEGVRACEETLNLYDILTRDDWQEQPAWRRLSDEERHSLAEDARELLLLLAWAKGRLTPNDPAALRQALALLNRGEELAGLSPSRALWLDRAEYLGRLGETGRAAEARRQAETIPATGARDHYLLASAHIRQGTPEGRREALAELDRALRLNPRHYWSWVQRGLCHQELGDSVQAAADFGTCIGLRPDFAWGWFCRGWLLGLQDKKGDAIRDYTAALELDPALAPAHLNRGLAYLELRKHREALADFERALELGKDTPILHAGRGMALEGLKRYTEADLAFERSFAQAEGLALAERTRLHWAYGFAVAARLPGRARQAFDEAIRLDPACAQALYGRAFLAMEANRLEEALPYFDRAIATSGRLVEPRRYRALLLARLGRFDRASEDINWCLERESQSGATLYTAACVAALAAEQLKDGSAGDQALGLLEKALSHGIPADKAVNDRDLAGIRDRPRFKELVQR